MTEYAPGEVKYKLATLRSEVGEMALTYIHELEQINSTTLAQLNYNNGELIIENEKLRKENEELEAQIAKLKNQKVFLLQRVDSYDNSIDKQFYTTDEELAKEWDDYYRRNYYYGEAIELKEFSDKERVKEELENG